LQLLNPRKKQRSTLTLLKSSPFNPPLTNQEIPTPLQPNTYYLQPTQVRLLSKETQKTPDSFQIQNQMMKMSDLPKNKNSSKPTCHGLLSLMIHPLVIATPAAKKPVGYSEPTTEISPKLDFLSKLLPTHPQAFPQLNGNKFSKETPSTSTRSLHHSTMLSLMKREWVAWETQKLKVDVVHTQLMSHEGL
jgi:hypothetical protein